VEIDFSADSMNDT